VLRTRSVENEDNTFDEVFIEKIPWHDYENFENQRMEFDHQTEL